VSAPLPLLILPLADDETLEVGLTYDPLQLAGYDTPLIVDSIFLTHLPTLRKWTLHITSIHLTVTPYVP